MMGVLPYPPPQGHPKYESYQKYLKSLKRDERIKKLKRKRFFRLISKESYDAQVFAEYL
jgi:hypothetical protein